MKIDEDIYECRLCTDLDDVPHPGLAHEDQEDEDSLQAVDGVEQDNLPACQHILFFIVVLTLMMAKTQGQTKLSM
jgi:hypothetical protein